MTVPSLKRCATYEFLIVLRHVADAYQDLIKELRSLMPVTARRRPTFIESSEANWASMRPDIQHNFSKGMGVKDLYLGDDNFFENPLVKYMTLLTCRYHNTIYIVKLMYFHISMYFHIMQNCQKDLMLYLSQMKSA